MKQASFEWSQAENISASAAEDDRPLATEPRDGGARRWITTRPGLPYFVDEDGAPWTPIGANEAITWPELAPLFRRKDLPAVERHLRYLKEQGVTCLRLMLEYCHGEHRYFEKPVGRFVPNMIALWDDLFMLLEKVGLRVLLTPYDTFFMWIRWRHHPYRSTNGGPCSSRRRWLTCPKTRDAIKARLAFASDRWGGSPALFAWDVWNEVHPAHGGDDPATIAPFVQDISEFMRAREIARYGRAHPQTVSIFGPQLIENPATVEAIFRHPSLDFASTHLYEHGTIDDPRDTVAPAVATGRLIASAVSEAVDGRPVFDSEHGPIHRFKDKKVTLPAAFDDEYFRHIQWAHLGSGGAGGGMRWPNRHPHILTPGMRDAQGALARFLPLIDWTRFHRQVIAADVVSSDRPAHVFACGDPRQAVLYLLSAGPFTRDGRLLSGDPFRIEVRVPGLADGSYRVIAYATTSGKVSEDWVSESRGGSLTVATQLTTDLAIAIRPSLCAAGHRQRRTTLKVVADSRLHPVADITRSAKSPAWIAWRVEFSPASPPDRRFSWRAGAGWTVLSAPCSTYHSEPRSRAAT